MLLGQSGSNCLSKRLALLALLLSCSWVNAKDLTKDSSRELSKENAALVAEVTAAERAFAKTMAERNVTAFAEWIDDEAIFYTRIHPTRGKAAIVAEWTPLFAAKQAPFSWEPDDVVVLESGRLAMSSGPVRDPAGKIIARFNSIWRKDANQRWKVVLDKGNDICRDAKPASAATP